MDCETSGLKILVNSVTKEEKEEEMSGRFGYSEVQELMAVCAEDGTVYRKRKFHQIHRCV